MAETTENKKATKTKSATKTTSEKIKEVKEDIKDKEVNEAKEVKESKPKKIIPKEVDIHEYITVKNGFHGPLTYISSKTGERFYWESAGDEQEMELGELKSARNASKNFFINNWFMFDEEFDWVIDYLGMGAYYKFTRSFRDLDTLFELPIDDIVKEISEMPKGLKKSISYKARDMITEGTLDSNKLITALEEVLETELVER